MSFAIAAGHDATADAAQEILKNGGNAFDAAIAALMTSFVAEPCMSSGGGGAFANIRKADGTTLIYDFFCQTPKYKKPVAELEFLPIEVDFGTTTEVFHMGKGSVGVPGMIAGIFALHRDLGSMSMKELVQLPIQYAKEGVAINDFQSEDMHLLKDILRHTEHGRSLFFKNDQLLDIGAPVYMPALADFLEYLAIEGAALFYKGEIAQKVVAEQREGGLLTMDDFEQYQVLIRKPLRVNYRNHQIYTNPLPSIGGSLLVHYLKYLEALPLAEYPLGKTHLLNVYQALERAESLDRRPDALALALRKLLDPNKKHGSTSHFNVVDKWGNAISLTMTIGEGSGYFIEGTDIQLNNMLGEAALLPDGFHSWDPDVRLSSMMTPTIVTDAHQRLSVVTGSGGASRIPSAITQVLHYLIDYQQSVDEAVNHPRAHLGHGIFNVEPGFHYDMEPGAVRAQLKRWDRPSLFFGGVHTILSNKGALYASGDERRDGVIRIE